MEEVSSQDGQSHSTPVSPVQKHRGVAAEKQKLGNDLKAQMGMMSESNVLELKSLLDSNFHNYHVYEQVYGIGNSSCFFFCSGKPSYNAAI